MPKKKMTIEDLAKKMDQGFKDSKQYVNDALEQVVLPQFDVVHKLLYGLPQSIPYGKSLNSTRLHPCGKPQGFQPFEYKEIAGLKTDIAEIKEDSVDHRLQTNRIEQMLQNEIARHDDHSVRIERLENKTGITH